MLKANGSYLKNYYYSSIITKTDSIDFFSFVQIDGEREREREREWPIEI